MSRSYHSASLPCALGALLLGFVAVACGDDERLAPVGGGGGDATTSASTAGSSTASSSSSSASSGGGTGGGAVIRTVFERNPFGAQVDNLLADGDFELSFGFAGQQGWTAYTASFQQTSLVAETGGLCRSGLRCARVEAGLKMFSRGTSAADHADMTATLWAKPTTTPDCSGVSAIAIRCDSFLEVERLIRSETPDEDGWCSYSAVVLGSTIATCLYVENDTGQTMIFDDASLVVLPPDSALRSRPRTPSAPVSAEMRARMDGVRDRVRETLPIGRPPVLRPGAAPLPGRPYAEPPDLGP